MARSIRHTRDLGAFIHDARAQQGLTQQQLADKAGVSRTWLIGVEHGQRPGAEIGKIFALLRALNLDVTLEVMQSPHRPSPMPGLNSSVKDLMASMTAPSSITLALRAESSDQAKENPGECLRHHPHGRR